MTADLRGDARHWSARGLEALAIRAHHPAKPEQFMVEHAPAPVVQTSKSAVSQVSQPARRANSRGHGNLLGLPIWKSATQQVWKPAPRHASRSLRHGEFARLDGQLVHGGFWASVFAVNNFALTQRKTHCFRGFTRIVRPAHFVSSVNNPVDKKTWSVGRSLIRCSQFIERAETVGRLITIFRQPFQGYARVTGERQGQAG